MNDRASASTFNEGLIHRKRGVAGISSEILMSAAWESLRKLNPRTLARNPVMFVVEVVSALTTVILIQDIVTGQGGIGFTAQIVFWLWFTVIFANFSEAVAEGRGKAQAENLRRTRTQTQAKRLKAADARSFESVSALDLKEGDLVLVEAGDMIPSDGDVIEGVASVDEIGHHRRIRARHPRERRRSLGGHRRHAGALRLGQGPHYCGPGLDLPRPDDRSRRGRGAAEDAERDRAQRAVGRHDDHLRLRHGHHPELRQLCRRCRAGRHPGGAVRHPDPDDHRRAAVGHRHRRHGPAGQVQRARHVGPRGRGGGRRRHPAAGQDRHHHAGQPPGGRVPAAAGHQPAGAGGGGPSLLAQRRDSGRPLDRRAGQGQVRPSRP